MRSLTVTRKADRAKMAAILIKDFASDKVRLEIKPGYLGARELRAEISVTDGVHRASITVYLDGDSCQPNCFVATWNTRGPDRFAPIMACLGAVNPHHLGKATRVCYGFDDLRQTLAIDIARLTSGGGFLPREECEAIAA